MHEALDELFEEPKRKRSLISMLNEMDGVTDVIVYYDYEPVRSKKRAYSLIGALVGLVVYAVLKKVRR